MVVIEQSTDSFAPLNRGVAGGGAHLSSLGPPQITPHYSPTWLLMGCLTQPAWREARHKLFTINNLQS